MGAGRDTHSHLSSARLRGEKRALLINSRPEPHKGRPYMPQARASPRYGPKGRTLHAAHTLDRAHKKAEGAVPDPRTGQRIACTQPAKYPTRGIYVAPVRTRAAAIPKKTAPEGAVIQSNISLSFERLSLFGLTFPDSHLETRAWSTPICSASWACVSFLARRAAEMSNVSWGSDRLPLPTK